ncbi:YdcF family protein [Paenibacillus sp. N1-5-1-14]|uniref:YdcF family protein n=1 Tax=Paenibacillus radicibacter TaxID=2972488 RepID=UPI002158B8E8|nr:YdcF family protein [Paenibacillus radicibacter]MCR8641643.1 YdcF family protein [Paenibacillus radicibacter]
MKKIMKKLAWSALIVIILAGAYFGIMSYKVMSTWKNAHGKPSDCMIVLGAAVWDGKPSPAMRERLDIAIQVYNEKLSEFIIVSGGKGADEEISEAEAMKTYLVDKGIPASNVILEDQSRNTFENLSNSKKIMEDHQFENAILVTHGFHALRASMMANAIDIRSTVEPVQIEPINLKYYVFRESAGIAVFETYRLIDSVIGTNLKAR